MSRPAAWRAAVSRLGVTRATVSRPAAWRATESRLGVTRLAESRRGVTRLVTTSAASADCPPADRWGSRVPCDSPGALPSLPEPARTNPADRSPRLRQRLQDHLRTSRSHRRRRDVHRGRRPWERSRLARRTRRGSSSGRRRPIAPAARSTGPGAGRGAGPVRRSHHPTPPLHRSADQRRATASPSDRSVLRPGLLGAAINATTVRASASGARPGRALPTTKQPIAVQRTAGQRTAGQRTAGQRTEVPSTAVPPGLGSRFLAQAAGPSGRTVAESPLLTAHRTLLGRRSTIARVAAPAARALIRPAVGRVVGQSITDRIRRTRHARTQHARQDPGAGRHRTGHPATDAYRGGLPRPSDRPDVAEGPRTHHRVPIRRPDRTADLAASARAGSEPPAERDTRPLRGTVERHGTERHQVERHGTERQSSTDRAALDRAAPS